MYIKYIVTVIITVIFTTNLSVASPQPLDKIISIVNNEVISHNEVEQQLDTWLAQMQVQKRSSSNCISRSVITNFVTR